MPISIVSVSRDGDLLDIETNEGTVRRTIKYEDTVVSIPPTGSKKVENIYIDPATNKLTVVYEA